MEFEYLVEHLKDIQIFVNKSNHFFLCVQRGNIDHKEETFSNCLLPNAAKMEIRIIIATNEKLLRLLSQV